MKTLLTLFIILLLLFASIAISHAEEKLSNGKRIDRAEWNIIQTNRRTIMIYDMLKAIYLETHTQEEFEKLFFDKKELVAE